MKGSIFSRIIIASFLFFGILCSSAFGQINADFTTSTTSACNSLQTTFFDQSTSSASIIDWSWDLSGNSSLEQNPGALFTEPGSFTICLTITDVDGNSDTECKEDYITVFPNPVADFTIDQTEGCAPIIVNFSDNSSSQNGDITSWLWDVGGSAGVVSQSLAADFTSTYSVQGSYTTSLTVIDEKGCQATTSLQNAVIASSLTTPNLLVDLVPSCSLPWEINFSNSNSDPLISYIWDFGNGETYNGAQPPTITYSELGTYDVTVYMESGDCKDTIVFSNFIDTNSSASFSFSPEVPCEGSSIQFSDNSLINADAVIWDFGDGSTSADFNPSHSYTSSGCYDVTLIRTVGSCMDTFMHSCIDVRSLPNINYNITNQYICTIPTEITLNADYQGSGDLQWEFSDGTISPVYNVDTVIVPIQDYGLYYAVLTFSESNGCTTIIDSIPIDITPFEANMPTAGISGCTPLTFTLSDSISSNVEVTSYNWTIGGAGGLSSSLSTPTFTISDTGRYDVQLIAENIYGCIDTVFLEDYIRVGNLPEIDFVGSPLTGCVEVDKYFTNLSTPVTDEWQWIFGVDSSHTEENPIVTFGDEGTYDVTLIASHNGCADSLTIENYITIFEPVSRFDLVYNCEDPYTVEINNRSAGADSLFWTLELSDTEQLIFTDSIFGSYTFPDRGNYPISHYSYSYETGCEHTVTDTIRIVDPIASYAVDTLRGCAPFDIQIGDFSQDAFIYEFVSDIANIDTIFKDEPIVTFNEGGVLLGPLLIITDIHECRDSFQLKDSIAVNKLEAIVDITEVICVPDVAEFNDISTDELGNIISWEWNVQPVDYNSADPSTSLYIDSVGMYDVYFKVVDDWGCVDSILMPQAINAVEIIPDFTFDSLGCVWAPIQFISLGDNGNVASYSWEFGDGTTSNEKNPSHTYATEGRFSVCLTMNDSRGCGKTICKENIVNITNPVAELIGDPRSATCPPLLTNFTNESQFASSFIWDFGDNSGISQSNSPSHVYTSPGRYDVTLVAQSTAVCSDTLVLPEYVIVEGPVGDFVADVSETCLPIGVTLEASSDDLYSYVWDLGNGVLDSVSGLVMTDTISFEYSQPGRYTPKLIITDTSGCTRSFAGNPIQVDAVEIGFTMDSDPICGPPLAVSLQNLSEGTTDDIEYTWLISGPDDYVSSEQNPSFDIQQTGLYVVSLIATYGTCVDTLSIPDFMEVADIPDVSFEIITDELCENVKVDFVNTSQVDYGEFESWLWDFGDGTTSTEQSPSHQYSGLESQTITLIGITDRGCEAVFTDGFDVLPSTIASLGEDELICIGDQIQLFGTIENLQPNGDFYWEDDPSLSCTDCYNPVATPTSTTFYVLVGVHPNGCESRDTINVEVIQSPGPELALIADSLICLGNETIIDVINFNSNYSYEWDTSIEGQDCYTNCDEVMINPDTITTYYVTVYNEFGCFKKDSVTVDVESTIDEFLPTETAICFGEMTTIGVTGGNSPFWSAGTDIDCNTCIENEVSPTSTEMYHVTVLSDIGCSYTDSILVMVIPDASADAGEDREICVGESVELSSFGFGLPMWDAGHELPDSNSNRITVSPQESQFVLLNMSLYECTQEDSLYITVYEKADIEAIGDTICVGETAQLSVHGRADNFDWNVEGGNISTANLEIGPIYPKEYQVIGTYRTCEPDTATALAYVHPHIDYKLEENFYQIFLNDEVAISPMFDATRNYSFDWFPIEGLDCTDCPAPIIKGITESMDYNILITDEDTGCKSDLDIRVRFNNVCTNSVFHLPNIFSPNNDGQNDSWRMYTNNPEEFISMSVYDRYGNNVFFSDQLEESWDGKFKGRDVVNGVYVYKVKLICPYDRKEYYVLGDVTVIR